LFVTVVLQMAGQPDKAGLFESCKFLKQLKTRGDKHLDRALKSSKSNKFTLKDSREVVKVQTA
jgi:hypothetical protein